MHKPPLYKLAFAIAFAGVAAAQTRLLALKDYFQIEQVSAPTLSSDGRKVAYVRTRIVEAENKRQGEIWVVPVDHSVPPGRVSDAAVNAANPRWSPDGKLLAYSAGGGQWFVRMETPRYSPSSEPFQIPGVT